jgi:hypothetical protein
MTPSKKRRDNHDLDDDPAHHTRLVLVSVWHP